MIGIGFYLGPFLGLWWAIRLLRAKSLRKLLGVLFAVFHSLSFSVWLFSSGNGLGLLLKEVGGGILINLRRLLKQARIRVLAHSEVAALAILPQADACSSFLMVRHSESTFNIYGLGSIVCSFPKPSKQADGNQLFLSREPSACSIAGAVQPEWKHPSAETPDKREFLALGFVCDRNHHSFS